MEKQVTTSIHLNTLFFIPTHLYNPEKISLSDNPNFQYASEFCSKNAIGMTPRFNTRKTLEKSAQDRSLHTLTWASHILSIQYNSREQSHRQL